MRAFGILACVAAIVAMIFGQWPAAIVAALAAAGGYQLTHAGRIIYCESCPDPDDGDAG